jgi:hypothetical protein
LNLGVPDKQHFSLTIAVTWNEPSQLQISSLIKPPTRRAPDISCDPKRANPSSWYHSLVQAGAVGVIQINSIVGRDPGVDIQSGDRNWGGMNITIPVMMCGNTGTLSGETASQARIMAFDQSWRENDPALRPSPFNESMVVSDVYITGNEWIDLFDNPLYQFAFHVVTPAMFFFVSFQV